MRRGDWGKRGRGAVFSPIHAVGRSRFGFNPKSPAMIRFLRRLLGFREKKPSLLSFTIATFNDGHFHHERK